MCKALALIPGIKTDPDRAEIVHGESPEAICKQVFGEDAELRLRVCSTERGSVNVVEGRYAYNGYGTPNLLANKVVPSERTFSSCLGGPVLVFGREAPHTVSDDWAAIATG